MGSPAMIPPPTDNIPVPKNDPVEYRPPQQEQLPVGAGFTGAGGQVANIASQFLTGWMTGKYLKEQRMQREAASKVGNAKSAVDLAASAVSNLLKQGKDESDPDVQNARRALAGAWSGYVSSASEYATPAPQVGPDGKPVKQSLGSKVKGALEPHHPEMMTAAVLQGMQKMDPQSLVAGLSPAEKEAQLKLKTDTAESGVKTQIRGFQSQLAQNQADLAAAVKSGDTGKAKALQTDMDSLRNQIKSLGGEVQPLEPIGTSGAQATKLANIQQTEEAKQKGTTAMQAGTPFLQLPDDQKLAFGWNPEQHGEFDAYLSQVKSPKNPTGKFNNEYEAVQALNADKRRAMLLGRYAPPYIQMQDSTRAELEHELQDPAAAAKYGLSAPLRPGDPVPTWLVDKLTNERYRQTAEEKAQAKISPAEVNRARGGILDEMVQINPDFDRFTATGGDPKTGMFRTLAPPVPKFYESKASVNEKYGEFQRQLLDNARRTLTDDEIKQTFPELRPIMGAGMASPPVQGGGSPAPAGNANAGAGKGWYTVTAQDGTSTKKQLSTTELARVKTAGFTVAPVGGGGEAASAPQAATPGSTPPPAEAATAPKAAAKANTEDDFQLPPVLHEITSGIRDLRNIDPEAAKRAQSAISDMMQKGTVTVGAGRMAVDRKMTSDEMLEKARAIVKNEAAGVQSRLQDQTDRAAAKAKADKEEMMRNAIIKAMSK